jgi:hypothetical protein
MRRLFVAFAASLALISLVGCADKPQAPATKALALPALAARIDRIDEIRFRGAGNRVLVTLRKRAGVWYVVERGDWPALPGLVDTALFALSRAHLAEAKTDQARLYPRLGVEDVAAADAQGMEVRLSGGGQPLTLIIGHEHPKLDGNYVRVEGRGQSWLTDVALSFEREPVGWIDRNLVDLPLARVDEVRIEPSPGKPFVLKRRGDRFWPVGAPDPNVISSRAGDALAGVLDHLEFEEVADDSAQIQAIDRRLRFVAVDGRVVELKAWRVDGKIWAALSVTLDPGRAAAWQAQAPDATAKATIAKEFGDWQQRFAGHAFQLPAYQASILYTSHDQILTGPP